tara:strand:- start:8509 stop:9294 length:786 start_codon:yes stop_codon:yes gene_type:complete
MKLITHEANSREGYAKETVGVLAVPFNGGCLGKNIGCEKAPKAILEGKEFQVLDIDNQNIISTNEVLGNAEGDIFIGGDHSITYSLFKGFSKDKENIGLVIFDAHPDCVNNFSPPTHEDFLKVLIEEEIVKPENVLIIGLRKIDEIEQKFLDQKNIKYVLAKDLENEKEIYHSIDKIREFVEKLDSWYLSIDIDVLNPKEAPGTGYIEEGGMNFDQLFILLEHIKHFGKLWRIDLVEVNPDKDINGKTINCAKKILSIFER